MTTKNHDIARLALKGLIGVSIIQAVSLSIALNKKLFIQKFSGKQSSENQHSGNASFEKPDLSRGRAAEEIRARIPKVIKPGTTEEEEIREHDMTDDAKKQAAFESHPLTHQISLLEKTDPDSWNILTGALNDNDNIVIAMNAQLSNAHPEITYNLAITHQWLAKPGLIISNSGDGEGLKKIFGVCRNILGGNSFHSATIPEGGPETTSEDALQNVPNEKIENFFHNDDGVFKLYAVPYNDRFPGIYAIIIELSDAM